MTFKEKIAAKNEKLAEIINNIVGNMYFFFFALAFVLFLRISHPPTAADFLLNIENDLQLLLLAVASVMGAKAQLMLVSIMKNIESKEDNLEGKIDVLHEEEEKLEQEIGEIYVDEKQFEKEIEAIHQSEEKFREVREEREK